MMPENKALLNAFQSVLVSWGDVDLTVPAFAAWRIRFKLQNQKLQARGQPRPEHGQQSVEPQPVPWRLSLAAAETIDAVTQMTQFVSLMPEPVAKETRAAISQRLAETLDDRWCPTYPLEKWPFPRPKFSEVESFEQADIIVAATLFHTAAELSSNEQLASEFSTIAEGFLKRGLQVR